MEQLLKIKDVGQLVEREWTPENGQPKTITSVEVTLTNGCDEFVAEANDDLAKNLVKQIENKTLRADALWFVRLRLAVRKSQTKGILFNSIRILEMSAL